MNSSFIKNQFKRNVEDKYVIYNSLFAALPFYASAKMDMRRVSPPIKLLKTFLISKQTSQRMQKSLTASSNLYNT
jgi:hypothetical protein